MITELILFDLFSQKGAKHIRKFRAYPQLAIINTKILRRIQALHSFIAVYYVRVYVEIGKWR